MGLGARLARRLGEGIGARVLGGAAENAGASLVGDELHSEGQASAGDLLKSALISGTVGAVTGGLPGSRGSMADTPSPKATLDATKQEAFKPLTTTHYDPNSVANDFSAATSGLRASQTSGIGDKFDGRINRIAQSIPTSGSGPVDHGRRHRQVSDRLNAAARGADVRIASSPAIPSTSDSEHQAALFAAIWTGGDFGAVRRGARSGPSVEDQQRHRRVDERARPTT